MKPPKWKQQGRACNHATCEPDKCRRPAEKSKPRKPIAQVSKPQAKRLRTYSALRKHFLEQHPNCQAKLDGCTGQATDIHHSKGRIGIDLLNIGTFIALCRNCHNYLETHPAIAKEMGLSESRLINNQ